MHGLNSPISKQEQAKTNPRLHQTCSLHSNGLGHGILVHVPRGSRLVTRSSSSRVQASTANFQAPDVAEHVLDALQYDATNGSSTDASTSSQLVPKTRARFASTAVVPGYFGQQQSQAAPTGRANNGVISTALSLLTAEVRSRCVLNRK
eukprot:jgi/Chrzof1/11862/Cz06g12220.t1